MALWYSIIATFFTFALILAGQALEAQDRKSIPPADQANPLHELISGYYFGTLKTHAMQDDDFDNPGFAWIEEGEQLWRRADGAEGKSCASCHQDALETMNGVATHYPKYVEAAGKVINLEQRINLCRQDKMKADSWKPESKQLLAMTAYIRNQSRGLPVEVQIDGKMRATFERGKKAYETRIGLFNLSCADCHNKRYGQALGSETISQGHSNGFPTFRLHDRLFYSLHERFRICNGLARATPLEVGSDEYVALELYVAWRGNGLPIETPAVRP